MPFNPGVNHLFSSSCEWISELPFDELGDKVELRRTLCPNQLSTRLSYYIEDKKYLASRRRVGGMEISRNMNMRIWNGTTEQAKARPQRRTVLEPI